MQNLQTGVAGGGTVFARERRREGRRRGRGEGVGAQLLNCSFWEATFTRFQYTLLLPTATATHQGIAQFCTWSFVNLSICEGAHSEKVHPPPVHSVATYYPPMLLPVMAHIRAFWLVQPPNHRPIRFEDLGFGANPPNTGSQGGSLTDRQAKGWCWSLKPFCRSTWETPTRASNWTRIPPCKISDKNPEFQRISHWIGEDFSLNWRGFVVPAPNHELL